MTKKKSLSTSYIIPIEQVARQIYLIHDQKVMFDFDLAELYNVPTKRLNEQVSRNLARFPNDFMFQLTPKEFTNLKSQIATSSWGGRRTPPRVFTEQGVAMLSSVLKSGRAVQMNILIIRAFVKLREMLASHKDLAERMEKIEASQKSHASVIELLAQEIDQMKELPPEPEKMRIGFSPSQKP